jgi:hypothetical protein
LQREAGGSARADELGYGTCIQPSQENAMGFFSKLFGTDDESPRPGSPRDKLARMGGAGAPDSDEQALERYRYMLKTAPPETLEQAHAEAFSKLTPEQRRKVLSSLAESAPAAERASIEATSTDDPRALARVATRAEVRQPGTLERTLGGGMGMGSNLLSSFAMGFVGSMVAQSFFSAMGGFGDSGDAGGHETASNDESADADAGDDGGDFGGGGDDFGGGDFEV